MVLGLIQKLDRAVGLAFLVLRKNFDGKDWIDGGKKTIYHENVMENTKRKVT